MKKHRIALRLCAWAAVFALTAGLPLSAGRNAFSAEPLTVSAEEEPSGYGETDSLYYAKYGDHVAITGSKSSSGDSLTLPTQIDGLPVTAIGIYAFQYHQLRTLTLPETITEIGHYAFSYCENLTTVTLPDSLQKMGLRTFEKCPALETVNFPDHLVETGEFSFDNTPWLEAQRKKDPLVIVNGALIDGRTCEGDVVVPSSVKYVAGSAFSKNNNITSVVFPKSVGAVKESTFWFCANLASAELKGVTSLGYGVFEGCDKLTDLKLAGSLKSIDKYTFATNNATATITFYGSKSTWDGVAKPENDPYLSRATYIFDENHTEPDEPQEIEGDVNMDGVFDRKDVTAVLAWLLAAEDINLKNWKAGDFNSDGKLNAADMTLMKRSLLRKQKS